MIKHIERLLFLLMPALLFTACTEDFGTEPGNDDGPNLSVFEQSTVFPNDVDVDGTYRVATNNKTEEVYYLAEPASSVSNDDSYAQKVVSQGTQVTLGTDTVSGGKVADVVVKNMPGEYTVSFVAVNGNKRTMRQVSYTGLIWNDIAQGTYHFSSRMQGWGLPETATTTLQQLSTDPTVYRLHNLYGPGYSLRFTKTSTTGSDDDGTFTYVTVDDQATGTSAGSYGAINVRDVATWQNDASYTTNPDYGCTIYDNNIVSMIVQYHVSAGSLGLVSEYFVPNN